MSRRYSVLIVEDDGDLRRLYRTALMVDGFDVREASTGTQALRELEVSTPDLVVLDLILPGLSGLSVQEEIAAHVQTRSIPVIIVTASAMNLDQVHVACVLRKPVAPEELVDKVRQHLLAGARGVRA
ncbi:MAG TPA: response regulator [Vicinamibacterales bacterium]|nr:response regulator [Vicinamibacterales bacterium]